MVSDSEGKFRSFASVGLDDAEEATYRLLLQRGGGTVEDVVTVGGLSERRVRDALASLQEKGLASRVPGRPVRYAPAPPRPAIDVLVDRRKEELEQARVAAGQLEEDLLRTAPGDPSAVIEVLEHGEPSVNRFYQLLTSVRGELLAFNRAPGPSPDQAFIDLKREILGRGVKARVVYSLDALEIPGVVDLVAALRPCGEEPRTVATLPLHLWIFDRRAAIVVGTESRRSERFVLHESALMDALVMLFESVWERAAPFEPGQSPAGQSRPAGRWEPSGEERTMLALLGAGMKDLTVARQLGLGPRTVERRLQRMMETLGTQTRFQTGVEVARRGWLGPTEERTPRPD